MALLVPQEFLADVNKYSGWISPKSKFSGKNLKGLFRTPENLRYLADSVFKLITTPVYVQKNLPNANVNINFLISSFKKTRLALGKNIQVMVEMTPMPYKEDIIVTNPIQQLHVLNKDFLLKSSRNMIQCPDTLVPNFYRINGETGEDESNVEYDYTYASWGTGRWAPEDLFMNSKRNRNNPAWSPQEVNYYSNPDSKGLGHRYNSKMYATTERTQSQFPRWQSSVEDEPYERNVDEALREGGHSDRRVQRNRGYNMANLVVKSTY